MKTYNIDSKLVECLDKYSTTQAKTGTTLRQSILKAQNAEMIVPVLGLQGKGKSTIINALLEENILPNEAGETTCAPVEVKYGTDECAKVHFIDRDSTVIIHSKDELTQYVDNDCNPGNRKQVAYVELFRNTDLLKSGIVIVDLPGVGSMTKENENTTKRYVQNLCSAVFVLSIMPPILRSEAMFIKAMWSQFSKAIFIEHRWEETQEEVKESCDYNAKRLKQIAKELNHPDDVEMLVVNGYEALHGSLTHNSQETELSNISALSGRLHELANNWEEEKTREIQARILLTIEAAIGAVRKQIADLQKSQQEVEDGNRQRISEYCKGTEEIEQKIRKIKRYLSDEQLNMRIKAKREAADCAQSIKVEIFRVVDGGVYDGERLSQAFADIQEDHSKELFDRMFDTMQGLKFQLEHDLEEIQKLDFKNSMEVSGIEFNKKDAFKWEKGVEKGFAIGGAAVGALYAKAAAALIVSNPAGWVVGLVGAGIFAIFALVGWGIKKKKRSNRASETKQELRPKIEELEILLAQEIIRQFDAFYDETCKYLNDILNYRKEGEMSLKSSLQQSTQTHNSQELEADLTYLQQTKAQFDENI